MMTIKKLIFFVTGILAFSVISVAQTDSLKPAVTAADTIRKKWISTKAPDSLEAAQTARYLLDSNQIFREKWNTEILFSYGLVTFDSTKPEVKFKLVEGDQKFMLTWYGHLFWGFGQRWGRLHRGLDIDLDIGDTVVAAFDGVIRFAGSNTGGYGYCIVMRHLNGLETLYGHLSKICVKPNQYVKAGQLIGLGGSTGRSNGPHLHFETRYRDLAFNPYIYIDTTTRQLKSDTLVLKIKDWLAYTQPAQSAAGSSVGTTTQTNPDIYYVRSGDCLYNIARRYGTSVDRIKQLNGLKSDIIYPGQKLRLR